MRPVIAMVNNRLLLGLVAFGISFGITLLTSRDFGRAAITGITTLPAVYIASSLVNRRSHYQAENRLATLRYHIQALQQRRVEAYEDFVEMLAEKERVALALNSLHMQMQQLQLSGAAPVAAGKALSWNLAGTAAAEAIASIAPHDLPTEIQPRRQAQGPMGQFLAEAEATRRKIEANLNTLQAELAQLKAEITEHRQIRDQVVQEISTLQSQQQQLETESAILKDDIQALERCRQELEEFLSYTEAKQQELEAGSHPLQMVLKELQAQIDRLHLELRSLETQVVDRRSQKDVLEQEIAALAPPSSCSPVGPPELKGSEPRKQPASHSGKSNQSARTLASGSTPASKSTASSVRPNPAVALPELPKLELPKPEKSAQELPSDWTEFMVQLPEHEFQVLKAIAEQSNPAPEIKRVAEANLTMPELLIDAINERALDVLGDLVIESKSGASSATIAREHQKIVKKLIKTYEYLMQ